MKLVIAATLLLCALALGCQQQNQSAALPPATPEAELPPAQPSPAVDPAERWQAPLAEAEQHAQAGQWEPVARLLDELNSAQSDLDSQQLPRLTKLQEQLAEHRRLEAQRARAAQLAEAERLVGEANFDQAQQVLNALLAAGPSDDERNTANALRTKIENQRKARRALSTAMRLLASKERGQIRAAQEQLWNDPEAAIPLLAEAANGEDPVLVANSLEMLRVFNQPQRALPVMVGVLSNPAQQASWPAAIRELSKLNQPGAGESLLKLALAAQTSEQRIAVLTALASVSDPPVETLVKLLPAIEQEGPELAAVLLAVRHAVETHRQTDLLGRRGIPTALSAEQQKQLDALPSRLEALSRGVSTGKPEAQAALALAIVTRQAVPQTFSGVKVLRATGEEATSPKEAVLDGVWNEPALDKLWRYPLSGQASIVFDLGAERTVSSVRIWNYNETSAAHRGWKDIEIFVSNSPALLNPVAAGLVPPAPGSAAVADYSITLAVPFVRGRYVKLQPKSHWRDDAVSGLTEVQILGF